MSDRMELGVSQVLSAHGYPCHAVELAWDSVWSHGWGRYQLHVESATQTPVVTGIFMGTRAMVPRPRDVSCLRCRVRPLNPFGIALAWSDTLLITIDAAGTMHLDKEPPHGG